MRLPAFLNVRKLFGQYRVELVFRHARPAHGSCPLNRRRCCNDNNDINQICPADLKQKWYINNNNSAARNTMLIQKVLTLFFHEWMNNGFQQAHPGAIVQYIVSQKFPVNLAFGYCCRKLFRYFRDSLSSVQRMDNGVGIADRYPTSAEHLSGCAFSHRNRAGKAYDFHALIR